ncbi:hypothetical protein [Brucella tritici]|uniref:hypothetical protein n=1 Tax=Brucella tritici TaxID=94626 RepID=UPI003CE57DA4
MDVPAWALGESVADQFGLVRAVVVHVDVDVEVGGHVALDLVKELAEFRSPVPGHAFADNGSSLHVKRSKQRDRSVPLVVVVDRSADGVRACSKKG